MRILILLLALLASGSLVAIAQNEKAPIVEKEFSYNNWTYKNIRSDEIIDLREFTKGKKLVMVVYFSAWCPNWKNEAPFVQKLYEKYKSQGFDVIGVSEYDSVAATRNHLDSFKLTFPVVSESEGRDAKKMTLHYQYRTAAGDTRNWGSPWNLFIVPATVEKKGDVLLKKASVVNGELIDEEVEKFVREKLGLPAQKLSSSNKSDIEICDPEKSATALRQP